MLEPTLPEAIHSLAHLDLEQLLFPVLIQLAIIIAVARLFAVLARKVGQPSAVGEIIAGLLLGPSLFGWLFPETSAIIFQPHLEGVPQALANAAFPKIFMVLAQLGLIFLLFLIGLEFEFSHLKQHGRSAFAISFMGIALPLALGSALATLIHPYLENGPNGKPVPLVGMALFLAVAMSITAIPILGRMMIELGMNRTRLGAITITAAAIDDAAGWILLATVQAIVRSEFQIVQTLIMIGETIAFGLFVLFVLRPILIRYFNKCLKQNRGELGVTPLAALIVVLMICAITTNAIGIFAIFGAFILGAALSDQVEFRQVVIAKLSDIVTAFFLPVFFTYTGLRTTVGAVDGLTMWLICGAVLATAMLGKLGGCMIAARYSGFSMKESGIIGIMMNTRALMELIVINIGYDLGVIPKSVFAMLVLMAIATTIMTTPIMLRLRYGTEIEAPIRESGFLK